MLSSFSILPLSYELSYDTLIDNGCTSFCIHSCEQLFGLSIFSMISSLEYVWVDFCLLTHKYYYVVQKKLQVLLLLFCCCCCCCYHSFYFFCLIIILIIVYLLIYYYGTAPYWHSAKYIIQFWFILLYCTLKLQNK